MSRTAVRIDFHPCFAVKVASGEVTAESVTVHTDQLRFDGPDLVLYDDDEEIGRCPVSAIAAIHLTYGARRGSTEYVGAVRVQHPNAYRSWTSDGAIRSRLDKIEQRAAVAAPALAAGRP